MIRGGLVDGEYAVSSLISGTQGTGNGGNLTINARTLLVRDGAQILASTFGEGKAGNLQITADLVEVTGKTSGLFVASWNGSGGAGSLIIDTGKLIVRDEARVSASSLGTGAAGNLEITAGSILIENQGTFTATTASGNQGNINLRTDSLIMRRGSEISTNATGKATGGNITIDTNVLAALENSDISANAEDSFGGQVIINAQGIFGTKFRPDNTPQSDITASSERGSQFSGTVQINTPEVDSNSGLVDLPENTINVSQLMAKSCIARRQETGRFYITGTGSLPTRPGDAVVSPYSTGTVRSLPKDNTLFENLPADNLQINEQIIEAKGVYKLENGQMVLGWECPAQ